MRSKMFRERAAKVYPYRDEDIAKLDEDVRWKFVGEQADRRDGYVQACEDILNPEMLWKIFQIGKQVCDELADVETTTEFFGQKILERITL